MFDTEHRTEPKTIVFWIIWACLFLAIIIIQYRYGGGIPEGEDAEDPIRAVFLALGYGDIFVATAIRWFLIPKTKSVDKLFVLLVIGLALSQAVEYYGLFLIGPNYPETQMVFFVLSLVCTLQFIPTYAKNNRS